ncbi:MAG: serine/threonine-protein kinase [Polyangiaceae bacterium]
MNVDDADVKTEILDPLVMRARARVGSVLHSKWRLDVLLGVGGMAAVYAATHRNGSRAAVKILHPELSHNADVRARFLREGYVANTVGHEGAVKVIDDDTAEDGAAFLVMELLDGETLEDRRVRLGGQLSEDDVLSVADQLLDVLAAAHAKGIVHRDLKPENVFLTRAGHVKILDFGIARLRELSSASTATQSGTTMGTPYYMAPEQARGLWGEVDGRTDLWAVGATMYHLLSGVFVHDGRTTNEVLLAAMTKPAQPLASVAPKISPTVTHVVDRALAFDREARWRDAHHMQESVRHAFHDRHGAPIDTAPRLTVPETVPNRTLATSAGAVAPKLPTTGQPVVESSSHVGLMPLARSPKVIGGAVALGIAVIGVAWALSSAHHATPGGASSSSTTALVAPAASGPIAGPAPTASVVPAVAETSPPTAAAAATSSPPPAPKPTLTPPTTTASPTQAALRAPTPRPAPAPTATSTAPSKENCNPNYTIDPATGRKHFKAECL